jgi:YfiH family protein
VSAAELSFELPGGGHVLFTTRAEGNLSSVGGIDAEHGLQARDRLRRQIGVRRLLRGYQVHGTTVQRVRLGNCKGERDGAVALGDRPNSELAPDLPPDSAAQPNVEADGQATDLRGLCALVLTADCLPVALSTGDAVAMIHAGWRGLAAGVLEEGVHALRELDAEGDLVAVIGPGAGPCCYEVGEEVHAAFDGAHGGGSAPPARTLAVRTSAAGNSPAQIPSGRRIDLKAIARDRLLAAGVSEVRDVAACTICDERFFSYRREGARAGRQGGVAWLS